MNVFKRAILISAVAALLIGGILTVGGIAPRHALSYAVAGPAEKRTDRLLSVPAPALPPRERERAPAVTEPDGEPETEPPATDDPTPDDAPTQTESNEGPANTQPVDLPAGAKKIVTKTYPSSLSVNNVSGVEIDEAALLKHLPAIDLSGDGPQILIVHTHTMEAYHETGEDYYFKEDVRSSDPEHNMVHVGEILGQTLTRRGYRVVHCTTVHDEDFNRAYSRSNRSIRDYLERYPSISVVIDLHRDSLIDGKGTKYRPVTVIDGEETAQVMLLMGVGGAPYPHPEWKENLAFALRIQQTAMEQYPGLMRPVFVRASRYNQNLTHGSILVELGACGNTLPEAERAARRFGEVLALTLDRLREARQ